MKKGATHGQQRMRKNTSNLPSEGGEASWFCSDGLARLQGEMITDSSLIII